jgi:very-short-patch-repair endonuclease
MKKNSINHDAGNLIRVRKLRSEMTAGEQILWKRLKGKRAGFGWRRQYPVGRYVLDFYCPEAKLCVEVDGDQHQETVARDQFRDDWLAARGVQTFRLPSWVMFGEDPESIDDWMEKIVELCQERAGRPAFGP